MKVSPLTAGLHDAWAALFNAAGSDCFCRYWHFEGTKNEWLARLAFEPEANREEQRVALLAEHPSSAGLVAIEGDLVVGWLKLTHRAAIPKLRRLPVYRRLDLGDDDGVLSIACVLVHPEHRRRGVARALVSHAIEVAKASRARSLEAYPHRRSEALREEELWMGPDALFGAAGFTSVGGNEAYPVLRYVLPR